MPSKPSTTAMRSGCQPTPSYRARSDTCSSVRRPTAARGAPLLRQLRLSGAELEQAAPRRGQGRVASGRLVPAGRFHRHQPAALCRGRRRFLQPARASSTSRKARTRSNGPACRAAFAVNAARLQSMRSGTTSAISCGRWRCRRPRSRGR